MIIDLPNTDTKAIEKSLAGVRESHSLASGRVLTLLVAVEEGNVRIDDTLATLRAASAEHPARVLVLVTGDPDGETRLDAKLMVTSDAGASEVVLMRLHGEVTRHLGAIVTPLLLPDTPVVACWPETAPDAPASKQLGTIAQRRITNLLGGGPAASLADLAEGYEPGDSDVLWSRITPWRGILASALDRFPGHTITGAEMAGAAGNPSVELAAGWLASSLDVEVTRCDAEVSGFPIKHTIIHTDGGDIEVVAQGNFTVRISVPGLADSLVAMGERTDAECLAEELRHLGPDNTYGAALQGVKKVRHA